MPDYPCTKRVLKGGHGTARHGSTWHSTVTARSYSRRARVRQNMDVLPDVPNGMDLEWIRNWIFVYNQVRVSTYLPMSVDITVRGALCAYAWIPED